MITTWDRSERGIKYQGNKHGAHKLLEGWWDRGERPEGSEKHSRTLAGKFCLHHHSIASSTSDPTAPYQLPTKLKPGGNILGSNESKLSLTLSLFRIVSEHILRTLPGRKKSGTEARLSNVPSGQASLSRARV